MKVGPQANQKKSKPQMGAAETVKAIKTNLMISTKKHLSMSNHFPANSRIFNRSLQELQRTADVISSHYLATSKEPQTRTEKPTSNFFPPYEHGHGHGSHQVNAVSDFSSFPFDAVPNEMTAPQDLRVFHQPSSEGKPKGVLAAKIPQGRYKPSSAIKGGNAGKGQRLSSPYSMSKPSQTRARPSKPLPRPAATFPPSPLHTNALPSPQPPSSSHLPIRQPPVYNPPPLPVSMGPVKLPISGTGVNNNPNKCLLLNLGPQNPVILNKKQILQTVPSRRAPALYEVPVNKSLSLPKTTVSLPKSKSRPCHNCQKLSKYLPFLGYSWRKLLGMDKSQILSSLVLMCEVSSNHFKFLPGNFILFLYLGLRPVREGDGHLR